MPDTVPAPPAPSREWSKPTLDTMAADRRRLERQRKAAELGSRYETEADRIQRQHYLERRDREIAALDRLRAAGPAAEPEAEVA